MQQRNIIENCLLLPLTATNRYCDSWKNDNYIESNQEIKQRRVRALTLQKVVTKILLAQYLKFEKFYHFAFWHQYYFRRL